MEDRENKREGDGGSMGRKSVFDGFSIKRIPVLVAIFLVRAYRTVISPVTRPSCRFIPTCSEYAVQAFEKYGFIKGGWLTVKRIGRCRPGGPYGYDPLP